MKRPLFWGVLVGFVVLSVGMPVLFLYLASVVSGNAGLFGWLALGSFIVLTLAATLWGAFSMNRNPPLGMGLLFGVLVTVVIVVIIPFVVLFIVLGMCLTGIIKV